MMMNLAPLIPASGSTTTKTIKIAAPPTTTTNTSTSTFTLRQGVDRGPSCDTGGSFAADLHSMRSTLIRTHDAGVLDWCVLFPNPTADTEDPNSYHWTEGDAYFKLIIDNGFLPYFRIGSSWNVPSPACLSPDPDVFARVAVRTVAHYNDGWANGFVGKKIAYLEVGNEPDGPRFWNGTAQQFYTLFDKTVRALKTYDSSLIVGGPGVSNTLSNYSRPYAFGLIDFVQTAGTPIDFYSWHSYGSNELYPETHYKDTIAIVRAYLNSRGLSKVRQHVTEWAGAILGTNNITSSPQAAAYVASAMTYFAQASSNSDGVDVAIYYPGCEGVGPDGSWGLFEDAGNGSVLWRRAGKAFLAVGQTIADTPVALTTSFAPETDYSVIAGAQITDDKVNRINVVVSASKSAYDSFNLTIDVGQPATTTTTTSALVSLYMIDATHFFDLVVANKSVPVGQDGTIVFMVEDFRPPAVAGVVVLA